MEYSNPVGGGVYVVKDDFAFDTNNIIVEFDARAWTQGGSSTGSNHIEPAQYVDADNYRHDTLRWGYYDDNYSRYELNGTLSHPDWGYPALNRTTWTRFRIEWNEDVSTFSYKDYGSGSETWVQTYSYDHNLGPLPLGGLFQIYIGGSAATATYDLDNILVTPEPATLSLLALGGLAVMRRRRMRSA